MKNPSWWSKSQAEHSDLLLSGLSYQIRGHTGKHLQIGIQLITIYLKVKSFNKISRFRLINVCTETQNTVVTGNMFCFPSLPSRK